MISVLIASMGRPHLAETLASLASASPPAGEGVEVIVADDSADGRARALVAGLDLPLDVKVVSVGAGNVAIARNALLEAAGGDTLIFVDDDETVEPDWLEGHVSAARDFAADAVLGPVHPVYPDGTPAWFVAADPLFQDWNWSDDGRVTPYGRTGNTLIRRAALGELRFDPAFGRTGGEDHDFFLRFAAAGHKMVVTDRARASERVPAGRATVGYVLRRALRGGQIYGQLELRGAGFLRAAVFFCLSAAKVAVAAGAGCALLPFARGRALGLFKRAATNLGKLRATVGAPLPAAWS